MKPKASVFDDSLEKTFNEVVMTPKTDHGLPNKREMIAQLPEAWPTGWRMGQTLVNFIRWCEENHGTTPYYWSDKKTREEYWKFIGEMLKSQERSHEQ